MTNLRVDTKEKNNLNLPYILSKKLFDQKDLVAIYAYGSRVYGNFRSSSDYDYIIIVNNKTRDQYSDSLLNISFYTPTEHQQRLDDHEISALECFFLPKEFVLFESIRSPFTFKLDTQKLRHSLSAKSSNSWVKAKKKLTIDKDMDLDVGRKSLFHAFRIIEFGCQLAEHGAIIDYRCSNLLFHEIMHCYTWNEMYRDFKLRYNNTLSRFKILAPKL